MGKGVLILVSLVSATFLVGCSTPRGLNHSVTEATPPILDPIPDENLEVAKRLALSSGEYVPVNLAGYSFEARVGESYKSALGEDCRRVHLRNVTGTTGTGAICKDSNGIWRYLAPLN